MAVKMTLLSVDMPRRSVIEARILLTLSGNYPGGTLGTSGGGDTLDFTQLRGQQAQQQPGGMIDSDALPFECYAESLAQDAYYYNCETYAPGNPPTPFALNACKLRVLAAAGTEFSSGSTAYSTATNDCIRQDQIIMHAAFTAEV